MATRSAPASPRPAPPAGPPRSAANAGIVDILVPLDLLEALTEGELANGNLADPAVVMAWLPVIEDIARRADGTAPGNGSPDPHPHDPARARREARRRFPRAGMRRNLQLAMATCIGVGCRRPSVEAEMDHTHDHALGGDTVEANLGPACPGDHALKTKGGWRLKRLDDHTFRWTTRLGRTYDVAIAPLIEDLPPPGRPAPRP